MCQIEPSANLRAHSIDTGNLAFGEPRTYSAATAFMAA
jgi:hypothetical protein